MVCRRFISLRILGVVSCAIRLIICCSCGFVGLKLPYRRIGRPDRTRVTSRLRNEKRLRVPATRFEPLRPPRVTSNRTRGRLPIIARQADGCSRTGRVVRLGRVGCERPRSRTALLRRLSSKDRGIDDRQKLNCSRARDNGRR